MTRLRSLLALGIAGCLVVTSHSLTASATPRHAAASNGTYTDKSSHITVTVTRRATDTKGRQYVHPARGKEWEFLYVVIRNAGSKAQSYNEFDFHLVDQKGQVWDLGFTMDEKYTPPLNSGKVPARQQRAGWISFELPVSTRSITVMWDKPNTFEDQAQIGRYFLH